MAAEQVPVRKTVVPPHHYPNWKAARGGPRVVEYTSDTDSRRNKRNERRKTLFRKSHELAVISAGHVFTMYIDDNGQAWIYTNSDALWQTYCTIGLKQGPLEKRCDENIKVIDVSDAHLEETKFYGAAAQPSEPTENTEHTLYPEIKTELISSPDEGADKVGGMAESSEENSPQPMQQRLDLPGSQFNSLLPQPTMKWRFCNYCSQTTKTALLAHRISIHITCGRYPNWKPFTGKHQIEYVANTAARRGKRFNRRKSLFRKSHELAVISGGHVFTMYIDDNGQPWIYTNSESLWKTYCTIGLKQGPLEKRCDENIKVIDVSDAHLDETKFSGGLVPPSEPTENIEDIPYPSEAIPQPVEIKPEPIFSSDVIALEVDSLTDYSEGSSTQGFEGANNYSGTTFDNLVEPTMIVKTEYHTQEQYLPKCGVVSIPMAAEGLPSLPSPKQTSKPQVGQKRKIEPQEKYRIVGSSCEDCARGFPDKKKLRLHLSCHKAIGKAPQGHLSSSSNLYNKNPP